MSIQDICYQRLLNLHQPGGESTVVDLNNLDKKLSLKFTKGGLFTDKSYLEGVIDNLNLNSEAVLDPFCVEEGCVVGGGIWTTAITSDISRDNEGTTEYWLAGSLDSEGDVWVLDLGIINSVTGDFIIKDKSVPINNKGYFKSRIIIPEGIKLALLRRVTYDEVFNILHYFGEYRNGTKISRSETGYLLNYNAVDQASDLEVISLGLLTLLFSTYKPTSLKETIYYIKGELDYQTKKIIEDNLAAISNLLDFKSTSKRINSIPKKLTTYLTPELLYDDKAYLDNTARCVLEECVDSDCIESKEVFITSSRQVSTRAVAWFYILVYTYTVYLNNNQYTYLLDLLAFYLVNQIDSKLNLPSKGWSHTDVLSDSEEILEYNLSTAVVTYIVFNKHYNYSNQSLYLEQATNLEEAIWSSFYNFKNKTFSNSLSDFSLNIEELSYGLLFSNITNRADIVEYLLNKIESNLTTDYGIIKESINGVDVINQNKLSATYLLNNPEAINFTNLLFNNNNLLELSFENLLLSYSIKLSQQLQYNTSLKLQQYLDNFNNALVEVEQTNNFSYLASCITNKDPFNLEVISVGNYYLTNTLSFERSLVVNKVISSLPINFGWFSEKALQFSGNTYKLISSIIKTIITFNIYSKDVSSNNYLNSLIGYRLNTYLLSLKLTRLPQELDSKVKDYISKVMGGQEDKITKVGLTSRLNRFGISSIIKDTYPLIFKSNSVKANTKLGKDYFVGNSYASTNIVDIICLQPISKNIALEITKSLPIAVKSYVTEVITLEIDLVQPDNCTVEDIVYIEPDNSYLLQENESYLLQENGNRILLEEN